MSEIRIGVGHNSLGWALDPQIFEAANVNFL